MDLVVDVPQRSHSINQACTSTFIECGQVLLHACETFQPALFLQHGLAEAGNRIIFIGGSDTQISGADPFVGAFPHPLDHHTVFVELSDSNNLIIKCDEHDPIVLVPKMTISHVRAVFHNYSYYIIYQSSDGAWGMMESQDPDGKVWKDTLDLPQLPSHLCQFAVASMENRILLIGLTEDSLFTTWSSDGTSWDTPAFVSNWNHTSCPWILHQRLYYVVHGSIVCYRGLSLAANGSDFQNSFLSFS